MFNDVVAILLCVTLIGSSVLVGYNLADPTRREWEGWRDGWNDAIRHVRDSIKEAEDK